MANLADIYISRDDDAVDYATTPDAFPERAQYKNLTPLELSTLWAIIRDTEWDVSSLDEFPCLLQEDDGERLIHGFPVTMLTDLSELTPERIAIVSPQWGATEELGWSPDDAQTVIQDLVRLARRAIEGGKSLYLWNCV